MCMVRCDFSMPWCRRAHAGIALVRSVNNRCRRHPVPSSEHTPACDELSSQFSSATATHQARGTSYHASMMWLTAVCSEDFPFSIVTHDLIVSRKEVVS